MLTPKDFPKKPGVYIFKDSDAKIIYIGKAKVLRNRVQSYVSNPRQTAKTAIITKHIKGADYIITDSEVEALLLENRLIKQHSPQYNIMLKDDKTYAYIKVTDEKFPKIQTTRRVTKKGTYFGPYTDGNARKILVDLLNKHFKLCTQKRSIKRTCLNYHLHLCSGACAGKVTEEQYSEQVKSAINILKGKTKPLEKQLKKEMDEASKEKHYEIAMQKKEQIESLSILHDKQKVDDLKRYNQDIIAMHKTDDKAKFTIFSINKGVITGKKTFTFQDDVQIFEQFLTRYYAGSEVPHEVVVSEPFWDDLHTKRIIENYLARLRGTNVQLHFPKRGEKKALVELALKNIITKTDKALDQMQTNLNLPDYPKIIECFDISNLGDEHIVAGMTRWVNNQPDKSGYRKFKIQSVKTQDDFKSMHEAVLRRYKRLKEENHEMPNLIIIDGGKGQLGMAVKALKRLQLKIPIIGVAKQDEEIYLECASDSLKFPKNSLMMLTIRKIRDSVHRFAIGYNKQRRSMKLRESLK